MASNMDYFYLSMKSGIDILVIGCILDEYFTWLFIVSSSYSLLELGTFDLMERCWF